MPRQQIESSQSGKGNQELFFTAGEIEKLTQTIGDDSGDKEKQGKDIMTRSRFVGEGMSALAKTDQEEIRVLMQAEVDRQTIDVVRRIIDMVVKSDESGVFSRALEQAENALGHKKGELSVFEEMSQTLKTRLEFLQKRGELSNEKKMAEFLKGMEKVTTRRLEDLAKTRKIKKPPEDASSRRIAA